MSWFDRLRQGLSKTRQQISGTAGPLDQEVQTAFTRIDNIEDLEYALIAADVGRAATEEIIEDIRKNGEGRLQDALMRALTLQLEPNARRAQFRELGFSPDVSRSKVDPKGHVVMVIGVNGVGKTTTIAKLGQYYMERGQSVMFAAGDTFRAAAGTQLGVWGERLGVPVIQGVDGGDPAAVAFDAAGARKARGTDLLFVDTAGRLHNKHNLMEELKKVRRVIDKADPGEPAEVWLVLDAVTGQNGLQQAKKFHEATPLTGVVVTKLDGTAKGGILVPIVRELGVPIKFIGVGEQPGDLQPFDSQEFVRALFDVELPKA
ncbi:signal recognition particle-docking protein FtsY [Deinococcus radiodurans]|jgi:signal recognition particle-docking protein FtsY|uniref:Signal recognition particle receptor FtsY n=1 Tax=Deinococcus radiodurans (strain ATCC 13939 / DSM 20539 / JCM 16871 / CCUG 27074 / LMG 4051 / NBRC 15346 / NCIMB 9279 / VKM B-1422 / R1) TaxID=243230 RepID=FTSY_DEIRA|nr:signal recognition particle-docking protein FtsY [Deinococcus radiodurans]Q9RS67.1 RecName: Full=Signal recognition particle receptor FtsY; Short=SRP receptor [Deinococcus radiodurans R1 = ATCC 13939 = DSM 20539]AAF11805.1 signal recognition particle-docking protein FtsY [Deinococcus radiodurans R1 = ATCC 13939 = DSM 20539]ANC70683.1 signal recognition particle-docking protein FtsY [Deinococcus radiodurans R1 = ATCC 13939 = DSM 20539]QEM71642.1 signal recognition particle-docking protein Fts